MTDHRTILYDTLLSALRDSTRIQQLVAAENILDLTTKEGWKRKLNLDSAPDPSKYPQLDLSNGRYTSSGFTEGTTLGMEDATVDWSQGEVEWPVVETLEYIVSITTDDLVVTTMNDIEAAVRTAFLRLGPKLGFAWVLQWSLNGLQRPDSSGDNRDRMRLTSQIRMNVTLTFNGTELLKADSGD